MNYCNSNTPAAERCECYSFEDEFHEPQVHAICEVGQVCAARLDTKANYIYECLDVCTAGQPSPCYSMPNLGSKTPITSGQVGLLLKPGNTDLTFFPIAKLNTFLFTRSACSQKAGDALEWEVCELGEQCGKLTATTAKCGVLCPSASIAPEACLCRAVNGINVLAQPGQFCGEDGSVSEFNGELCVLNSFGNGTCKCEAGQDPCPATSVCVADDTTTKCMPACELNTDNASGADCACRGQTNTQIVPVGGRCVIQSDGTAAPQTLPICENKQIGPCACQVAVSSAPAQYVYTDASNTCFLLSGSNAKTVVPLMSVGSVAVVDQPCQNTVENPTYANMCVASRYCFAANDNDVSCYFPCDKDFVAQWDCACGFPDREMANLAAPGDFCSASGEVVKKQPELCHPSANVVKSCKCSNDDQEMCEYPQYCSAQNGTQTCMPMCVGGSAESSRNCVCPYSGSDAMMPENLICACRQIYPFQACAAVAECQPGQIGPCGVPLQNASPVYVNSGSAFVETPNGTKTLLLCKPNVIANLWCACEDVETPGETPTKATAIESSKGCMRKPDGTTEIVQECALGDVSGSACACRILKTAGGASYCDVGSVCMENPDDNTKQVCWRMCSAENPCPDGKECLGSGSNAHCEFTCAAGCVTCPEVPEFCTECTAGYYLSGVEELKTCTKCPATCTSCTSADSCQGCNTGFTGTTCNSCDTGYIGAKCDECNEGYAKASGSNVCEKIVCDPNCNVCLAVDNCKTCKPNYITTGEENEKTCMIDCLTAIPQCRKCTSAIECERCNAGYKNPATDCVEMMCADSVKDCISCTAPNGDKCAVCSKKGAKPDKNGVCANNLSSGAIAGIVIAVLVVVAAVCCGAYFFTKKQQSTKKQQQYNSNDQDIEDNKKNSEAAVAVDFGAK